MRSMRRGWMAAFLAVSSSMPGGAGGNRSMSRSSLRPMCRAASMPVSSSCSAKATPQRSSSPRVLTAVQAGTHRAIAVCFVEWAGPDEQMVVVNWTVIRDGKSASEFATALATAPRSFTGRTSISAAIDFAISQFARSGVDADRRIIDVSGDGTNNAGRPVTDARDAAVAQGMTINGLAIINKRPEGYFFAHTQPPEGLPAYYKNNVVGGNGAISAGGQGFHHLRRRHHQ